MRPTLILLALAVVAGSCSASTGTVAAPPTSPPGTSSAVVTAPPGPVTPEVVAPPATSAGPTTRVPEPNGVPILPRPAPPPPAAHIVPGFTGVGVVTIAAGGADLATEPGGAPFTKVREGLMFPARSMVGDWIEVLTTCDLPAWVRRDEVLAQPPAPDVVIGDGFDFSGAVIVIDPGHGGPYNLGAVGPDGLVEKEIDLDIARRVRDLLGGPHTIEWSTGRILEGDAIPAAQWVIMTRTGNGDRADYEAGLTYRSYLANAANAQAMISIHNNAGWEVDTDGPGSDVYYQSQIPESRRLARLLVVELRRSFEPFNADWVGAIELGAKSRLSPRDPNRQYYGILRRSKMPTVIAEGAYIVNRSEADLLRTPEFRQAYSDAVYRALVRFLTTDDRGEAPSSDPVVWAGNAGSGDATPACVIPAQGE